MKKTVIIAIVILIHIFVLLMISGSEEETTYAADAKPTNKVSTSTKDTQQTKTPDTKVNAASQIQKVYEHHVVVRGDNLSTIAKKYGTTVNQIKSWNNLKDDKIFIGKKLVVSVK